jgi:hypothetical protein
MPATVNERPKRSSRASAEVPPKLMFALAAIWLAAWMRTCVGALPDEVMFRSCGIAGPVVAARSRVPQETVVAPE